MQRQDSIWTTAPHDTAYIHYSATDTSKGSHVTFGRKTKQKSNRTLDPEGLAGEQVPILPILTLQLQRQRRSSRIERFFKVEELNFVFETH
jgi:hypothetical protein